MARTTNVNASTHISQWIIFKTFVSFYDGIIFLTSSENHPDARKKTKLLFLTIVLSW
jgi:hypothetical protein